MVHADISPNVDYSAVQPSSVLGITIKSELGITLLLNLSAGAVQSSRGG